MDALILGTVDFLRSADGLGLDSAQCDEQFDGTPTANSPMIYYAVHQGDWSNADDLALDEQYGLDVTITLRHGYVPKDRTNVAILRALRAKAAELRAKLHMSYTAMAAWNAKIDGFNVTVNGFVEPLVFLSAGRPAARGPEWFGAEGASDPPTGISCTLSFGRARRLQTIDGCT